MDRNNISHIMCSFTNTRFLILTTLFFVIISRASNLSTYEGMCSIDLRDCYQTTELIAIQIELSDESDTEQPLIVTSARNKLPFRDKIKIIFIFFFSIIFAICLLLTFSINVSFITIAIISLLICFRLVFRLIKKN